MSSDSPTIEYRYRYRAKALNAVWSAWFPGRYKGRIDLEIQEQQREVSSWKETSKESKKALPKKKKTKPKSSSK